MGSISNFGTYLSIPSTQTFGDAQQLLLFACAGWCMCWWMGASWVSPGSPPWDCAMFCVPCPKGGACPFHFTLHPFTLLGKILAPVPFTSGMYPKETVHDSRSGIIHQNRNFGRMEASKGKIWFSLHSPLFLPLLSANPLIHPGPPRGLQDQGWQSQP